MEYPLISEYKEAILSAEDNFNELSSLRPVLDSHGDPVMSSGNFAVVFKMRDESDGKLYAVKCFIKDQEGRNESYRMIADELEVISSSYILPLRYLENELFVDSAQCDREEFPLVVMEWVDGETLDAYLNRNLNDRYELEMLSYRFNRMAAWLLAQPFAHGDLKPDNILVRKDGSLVLVDYDGMFVPSMKGEKAREIGSPDYRHPARTDADFDEHIDDFSIAVIALSLKAIALNSELKTSLSDSLLLNANDYRSPSESVSLTKIQKLTSDSGLLLLLGIFYIALVKNSLDSVSFRLLMTDKPKQKKKAKVRIDLQNEKIDTSCSDKDLKEGIEDEFGVVYSRDGKRLLKCNRHLTEYSIKHGTQIICDDVFSGRSSLQFVTIPNSVTAIGEEAFYLCSSLQSVTIPDSVRDIGDGAFSSCPKLSLILSSEKSFRLIKRLLINKAGRLISCLSNSEHISIPDSVTAIGNYAFGWCSSLQSVVIPDSVTAIGNRAFYECSSLQSVAISDSVITIGDSAFDGCSSLQSVVIPDSVTAIGDWAFSGCSSLQSVVIPDSVTAIGDWAFYECSSLQSVAIPDSVTAIGDYTFKECSSLKSITILDSVTTIGEEAFSDCSSLQSVVIPDSVTDIGVGAFSMCPKLSLTLSSEKSFRLVNRLIIDNSGILISCLNNSEHISIPDSVTAIGDVAFYGCSSLKSVAIPDSVATIGDSAFCECSSLKSIVIPDSVTAIGNRAFYECSSLQSITIPDSVTAIGDWAFDRCSSLKFVVIPKSVTKIGYSAFPKGCKVILTSSNQCH